MEKIKLKNKYTQNHIYNLYITFGTLPALYSQINIFLDNTPSYVWVRSGGAFVSDKYFPNNLKFYKKFDGFNDDDFFDTQYKNIVKQIKIILKKDKNANFNIFCDDSRIQFLLKIIIPLSLESLINKITILSEGSITESMSRVVNDVYFKTKKMEWENFITLLKNKEVNQKDLDHKLALIDNYSFWLSTLDNVEYLIPNLNLLLTKTSLGNIKRKMNLSEINFSEIYKKISLKIRKEFVSNALGNIEFENLFENKKNKILIINGTYNFGNEEITTFMYSNLINKIIDDYGNKYILLYKAHPLFPVEKNISLLNFLNKNNILFLSEKVPLEIILWEYKNIKVGGFCSSTHSLIPKQQVEFFFGELNGFSKYIFKNLKNYNVNISQDLASASLNYYCKFISFINSINLLENKINTIEENINNLEDKISNIEKNINNVEDKINTFEENNCKNILFLRNEINDFEEYVKLIKSIFYPISWVKRKLLKLKEEKK